MRKGAVGFIETKGMLSAVAALDAALKASAVVLTSFVRVRGSRMMFAVEGEVAAVLAAVDAASQIASELHSLMGRHVIPSPDEQTREMIGCSSPEEYFRLSGLRKQKNVAPCKEKKGGGTSRDVTELEQLRTTVLRRMLRDCNDGRYEGREISLMRKEELLKALRTMRKDR